LKAPAPRWRPLNAIENRALAEELEALERRGWEALSGPNGATF
jgi:hypothetical protein